MNRAEWAKRPGRSSKWITKYRRVCIYKRDSWQCVYCFSKESLTLDHITPRIKGGTDDSNNLVTCCTWCNSSRGASPLRRFCQWIARQTFQDFREVMNRVRAARIRSI